MSAARQDIYVEQGTDFDFPIFLSDENDVGLDLTGHIFKGQIRKTAGKSQVLAEMTFVLRDQTTPDGKGWVDCSMSEDVTRDIPAAPQDNGPEKVIARYSYDIESVSPGGKTRRWLEGVAELSPETTR